MEFKILSISKTNFVSRKTKPTQSCITPDDGSGHERLKKSIDSGIVCQMITSMESSDLKCHLNYSFLT